MVGGLCREGYAVIFDKDMQLYLKTHRCTQGILRKHVGGSAAKASAGDRSNASGTDSDALWTVGSRCVTTQRRDTEVHAF